MNKLEKMSFRTEEVLSFIEDMIQCGLASDEEIEFYEDCKWNGKVKKFNHTYRSVILKMRDEWESEF